MSILPQLFTHTLDRTRVGSLLVIRANGAVRAADAQALFDNIQGGPVRHVAPEPWSDSGEKERERYR